MSVFSEILLTFLIAVVAAVLTFVMLVPRSAPAKTINTPLLSNAWGDRLLVTSVGLYSLVFGTLTVLRFLTFNVGYLDVYSSFDLGQYDQIVWNSMRGRLFENSFILDSQNFLGKTFAPILVAFVPLYAVWASPVVLLVVQTIALAAGAFPLFWLARPRIGSLLALGIGVAYLLSPALQNTNVAEFHEVALTIPMLLYTLFFLMRRHTSGFLVSLLVSLLIKEEVAVLTIAIGLFMIVVQRNWRLGLAVTSFGIVWTVLVLQFVIPYFRTGEFGSKFYYFGDGSLAGGGGRYAYLGNNLSEITATIVTRPDVVLREIWIPSKIAYTLHLLVPLAFLPILGIEASAMALPTLGYTLLSRYAHQHSLAAAYHAPILPFLALGAILGMQRVLRWREMIARARGRSSNLSRFSVPYRGAMFALVVSASLVSYYFEAPGPLARKFQPNRYAVSERTQAGLALMQKIPSDAVVVAQNEYLAHLSQRRFLHEIPLIDYRQVEYAVADPSREWYNIHRGYWEWYGESEYFDLISDEQGYLIYRRRAPKNALAIHFEQEFSLVGYSLASGSNYRGGQTLRPILGWRAQTDVPHLYVFEAFLLDSHDRVWKQDSHAPRQASFPAGQWKQKQYLQDQFILHLDHFFPAGEYRLAVRVFDEHTGRNLTVRDRTGQILGEYLTLETVRVEKSKADVRASQISIETRLMVDYGEIRLLGMVPPRASITPGEPLQVGLYWRARGTPQGDYVIAVQLRDAQGRTVFENVSRPAQGTYPTLLWSEGEVLLDWHDMALPSSMPPGSYTVYVVLRDVVSKKVIGESAISTLRVVN